MEKPKEDVYYYYQTRDALLDAGVWGKYQIYTCFVIQYASIVWAGIFALGTFGQLYPEYECHDDNFDQQMTNPSYEYICAISRCRNKTMMQSQFNSMTMEWNLVCDREVYMNYIVLVSSIGRLIGAIMGGHIGDTIGRKRTLYATQFGICVVSTLSIACQQWYTFAVCWGLTGLMYGLAETAAFTLTMEFTDSKHRWIVNASDQWILQYPICALIAWLTGDWRMYIIIINVIFAPVLVFFLIFMESPRWLIYKRHLDRAADVFNDLGSNRWDHTGFKFTAEQLKTIPNHSEHYPKNPTPWELFRTKRNLFLTLCLMLGMFNRSIVSSLFLFRWRRSGSNPFLNVAFYGLARIWVPFTIIFVDWKVEKFGRRHVYIISTSLVTICLILMTILEGLRVWAGAAQIILGLFGAALSASGVWMSLGQMTMECYPTAYRNIAFGYISTMDAVGVIAANYLVSLDIYAEFIPGAVLVTISMTSMIFGYLFIPETKGLPLADSLEEIPVAKPLKCL